MYQPSVSSNMFLFYSSGSARGDPTKVAESLFLGFKEYLSKKRHRHLQQITVVVYQPEHLSAYQQHLKGSRASGHGFGFLGAAYRGVKAKSKDSVTQ